MDDADYGFVAGGRAIDSLRKSGYKNVAYALGELVDNSIQANAIDINIIVSESQTPNRAGQMVWRLNELGILDNGKGMNETELRRSLRLGDGDSQRGLDKGKEHSKMGKFGVGLPQASISQCKRVEIWSWTGGGHKTSTWTYIDLDEFTKSGRLVVPKPVSKPIPKKWLKSSPDGFDESGTLIVWSKLDRCNWRTSQSIHRHSENLIGRMYRRHIATYQVTIQLTAVENEAPYTLREIEGNPWMYQPNDPLYLDVKAFVPEPPIHPMFEQFGEPVEMQFQFPDENDSTKQVTGTVTMRFSKATKLAREGNGYDPKTQTIAIGGSQPHGRHARKNMGLSIMRENRELELDENWTTTERNAAYERWWGAEVEFGREMDHIFDVTNNKQHAQNLNDVARKSWEHWRESEEESTTDIQTRLKDEDFSMWVCMNVADEIKSNLGLLRKQVFAESPGKKSAKKNERHDVKAQATAVIDKRDSEGERGTSDDNESLSIKEKEEKIREEMMNEGYDSTQIEEVVQDVIQMGYKVTFSVRPMDSEAFFSVEKKVGVLMIVLNSNHRAHKYLFSALQEIDEAEDPSNEELKIKAYEASKAVNLILSAWARYEDVAKRDGGEEYRRIAKTRRDWGTISEDFLRVPGSTDEDWSM